MKTTSLLPFFLALTAGPNLAPACLTEIERHGGHILTSLHKRQDSPPLSNDNTVPIGTGDRFNNGTLFPRGIGSRPYAQTQGQNLTGITQLETVYNVAEIKSALLGLQREYSSQVIYFELPHKTYQNATMFGAKVRSKIPKGQQSSNKGYRVLLEAAIHARERGGPDYTINFVSDLLYADKHSLPSITYGGVSYPLSQVRTALSLGIVIIPLVNPDGVSYDHSTNSCWRKNRNPLSSTPSEPYSIGIDLNRNFAPVWNFTNDLAPLDLPPASFDPSSETFAGTAPLSEPETKNIDWAMASFPDLTWFLDLHSMATIVLYGWGHDSNQVTDPQMNLLNPIYDHKRGIIPDQLTSPGAGYKEYIPQAEWDASILAAGHVASRMTDSTGRVYVAIQATSLYPTSGNSVDHGKWRKIAGKSKRSINGLVVEFGIANGEAECMFYPTAGMHRLNMIEVGVGLMELLGAAGRL
ncbi:putative peptidase [Rhypophila decipiens]